MNITLLYIVMALPHGLWHGSYEIQATSDVSRCESVVQQLNAAPSNGNKYRCETLLQIKSPHSAGSPKR